MTHEPLTGLALRSEARSDGTMLLSLARETIAEPGPDEVVVRMEAAPINPSDLGLLVGTADSSRAVPGRDENGPTLTLPVAEGAFAPMAARLDKPMPAGNEGAGTIVRAGANAQQLLGRTVALLSGRSYSQYVAARASDCLVLPEGATAAQGASAYVNPLTALSMVETMRREGHGALVHTAAASNLGRMLARICLADGVPLVNIVRSDAQRDILREIGTPHIVDSSKPDFHDRLAEAVAETGATLAFDAVGGGKLASEILVAMEAALQARMTEYSRYGSPRLKQVYIYGSLDFAPTIISRRVGMAWSVSGWLLTWFLMKLDAETAARLRRRVADELTTTFASSYTAEISLEEALRPEVLAAYDRKATGEKYLINPSKGLG